MKKPWLAFIFLIAQLCPHNATAESIVGRASVVDGDTIEIRGKRIRLNGIDAPESDQVCRKNGQAYRCGQSAAQELDNLIGRKTLRCEERGQDQYRRIIATCWIDGTDVGRWMVVNGHALAFRRYSNEYIGDEIAARDGRRGLWAGDFTEPWTYRAGRR